MNGYKNSTEHAKSKLSLGGERRDIYLHFEALNITVVLVQNSLWVLKDDQPL